MRVHASYMGVHARDQPTVLTSGADGVPGSHRWEMSLLPGLSAFTTPFPGNRQPPPSMARSRIGACFCSSSAGRDAPRRKRDVGAQTGIACSGLCALQSTAYGVQRVQRRYVRRHPKAAARWVVGLPGLIEQSVFAPGLEPWPCRQCNLTWLFSHRRPSLHYSGRRLG